MPTTIDLARVRADTPGCRDHIHLNNAGSSLPTRQTLDAQIAYLTREALEGGYEVARAHESDWRSLYDTIAGLIGASAREIALTGNATEAWQLGFHSFDFRPGDRILTGEASYASNFISFLKMEQERDVSIEVIASDAHGQTSAAELERMLDERVRLIALTHIPTNGGLINPAADIGAVANAAGIPFLLDACQSVGQLVVDVSGIGCDMLSATGRKFLRGPRGTGFLYVSNEILGRTRPPFLDLRGATWTDRYHYVMRDDARRYETWEFNVGASLALGVAVEYATRLGMAAIEQRVVALAGQLRSQLESIDRVTVHDVGLRRGAIVTFSVDGVDADIVARQLAGRRVAVSTSTPASTLLDATRRKLPDVVRASVHYFLTEDELRDAAAHVAELAGG
ncbi:MAG: aminotransferase class V-fold PLP-dependent enzyme [Acidimicrobiia bacterium]|nr:aminotransferase class V-fold PLP-dependent enzyme [Acidimicrobiia bacterium]